MKTKIATLVALVALAATGDALSQHMPGGKSRGYGSRGEDSKERTPRAQQPPEPFAALERELPSLKVDLKLTESQ